MGYANLTLKMTASGDSAAAEQFPEILCKAASHSAT
jgi:hypothetical protein